MAVALSHYILEQIFAQKVLTDMIPPLPLQMPITFLCFSFFIVSSTVPNLGNHISCYSVSSLSLNCDATVWFVKGLERFSVA